MRPCLAGFAVIALVACSKSDPPAPAPTASAASDVCLHPIPLTIGVATEGDLVGGRTECWSFDGLANVTLVLDVEVRSFAATDISVVDSNAKEVDVCKASVDGRKAAWGKPFPWECAIPRSAIYNLRLRGAGAYRFKLRRRD
jgi:hypothetical protein